MNTLEHTPAHLTPLPDAFRVHFCLLSLFCVIFSRSSWEG